MERGSLRCDVNVSLRPPGGPLGTKVELKNLNSFSNVERAIEGELARQAALLAAGGAVEQETRQYDAEGDRTLAMRGKEAARDYRYLPEPDLPPLVADAVLVDEQRALIPELPAARRARYVAELGLSPYDAGVLTAARDVADFFEATVRLSGAAKEAANWIANQVLAHVSAAGEAGAREADGRRPSIADLGLKPHDLAQLIELVERGRTSRAGAREILAAVVKGDPPGGPAEVMHALGLVQVSGGPELEAWCRAALEGREAVAAEVRTGNAKALGALIGPVMQASGGRADPAAVRATLARLIEAQGGGAAGS
jgi:aspartyl-tRNA(Asn)/glutamyl-tRNA(Gln) amidotransferase subunit B